MSRSYKHVSMCYVEEPDKAYRSARERALRRAISESDDMPSQPSAYRKMVRGFWEADGWKPFNTKSKFTAGAMKNPYFDGKDLEKEYVRIFVRK